MFTQEQKEQIIQFCKDKSACESEFKRLLRAETDINFIGVLVANADWCVDGKLFSKDEMSSLTEIFNVWIRDFKNFSLNKQTYNYKDVIKFTVNETKDNYEVQFEAYPDVLRAKVKDIKHGQIEGVNIYSSCFPEYSEESCLGLLAPRLHTLGSHHGRDTDIITIPKSRISTEFFDKLLNLLVEKYQPKDTKVKELETKINKLQEELNEIKGV